MLIGSTSSQLQVDPSFFIGMQRRVVIAPQVKAAQAMKMSTYVHGRITSMKHSASENAGILLKITAKVLLTQCMSMVSFSDPVL
jgi:hypothetical protein